ncbi:NAC domain [Dillenia turbinata]|uniref:NAC domain n=1 Tax=Dillenia turbinata TaxID=194707 RepID=A0AAN8VZS0_9MAGN
MRRPAVPPPDINEFWTDAEIILSLESYKRGDPTPQNVTTDVNPCNYDPANLPDDIWYFTHTVVDKNAERGFWKVRGDACRIFINSSIIGWRTTLDFYLGQVPHEHKTDWVMQEYSITPKDQCENIKLKDPRVLCRVFQSNGEILHHEKASSPTGIDVSVEINSNSMPVVGANSCSRAGLSSASESKVKENADIENGLLAMVDKFTNHPLEILPEDFISSGNYLELRDLDDPGSPSSSSENSSCLSMSSDEYFDSLALLKDLEPKSSQNMRPNCKASVTETVHPDEVIMHTNSSGDIIGNKTVLQTGGTVKTYFSQPGSTMEGSSKIKKQASRAHEPGPCNEGSSSGSHKAEASGHKRSPDRRMKAAFGQMSRIKRKYFCFMPF